MPRWTQAKIQELAEEERAGLKLADFEQIDPYALAEEHGVRVYSLSSFSGDAPEAARYYSSDGTRRWSAALMPVGTGFIIVENDSQPQARRRSNICHELGHLLLEHPARPLFSFDEDCYEHQPKLEREATLAGGFLLVPETAARKLAFRQATNEQVAERFGISLQMAQMRMKGARVFAQHALRRQGGG